MLAALTSSVAPALAPAQPVPSNAPRALDEDPPGSEKTPTPKAQEWLEAAPVRLTMVGPAAERCVATRVREWLRLRCNDRTFAVSLLGGTPEGVSFWIGPESEGQFGEVQFPLRRGDKRVVAFWTYGKDAEGRFSPQRALIVQEHWVAGAAAPTVMAQ
jgi:hypothetical protein